MEETPAPELIVCDTSFVGHEARRMLKLVQYAHWPPETVRRLDVARLAITPFTIGEQRAGWLKEGWNADKIQEWEDRVIGTYGLIPLDEQVVDEFARLYAHCLTARIEVRKHNDVWIAATASSRGLPLVSCDSFHNGLPGGTTYLPPPP